MITCVQSDTLHEGEETGLWGTTVFMMAVMKIDSNSDFQGVTCTAMILNTKESEKLKAVIVYLKSVAGSTEKHGRC
jgi:hypothetical protein